VAGLAAKATCLAAYTTGGSTAMRLARERPLQPVLALTPKPQVARKLALVWGLEPRVTENPKDLDDMTRTAVDTASALGLAQPGSAILVVAGVPFGTPGATNLLRLAHVLRLPR
jgi:pyruvate kinase